MTVVGVGPQHPSWRFITNRMEDLQLAYVAGVAAAAGCSVETIQRDESRIDVRFSRTNMPGEEETVLNAQLKSHGSPLAVPPPPTISHRFHRADQLLRLTIAAPTINSILILMPQPLATADWARATHQELSLRYACYWANLAGTTPPNLTVHVSTNNLFDPQALGLMMDRVRRGGRP